MTELQNSVEICETDGSIDTSKICLTRYLYIKEDVMASLIVSILSKDVDQALFWACELYCSGFYEQTTRLVYSIYNQIFRPKNPNLHKLMNELCGRWKEGLHIVGTMVRNMTVTMRDYTLTYFVLREINPPIDIHIKPEPKIQIILRPEDMKKYETIQKTDTIKSRDILKLACRFETKKDMLHMLNCCHRNIPRNKLLRMHRLDWPYYASFSPIWRERIDTYHGKIDHVLKRVIFEDDDTENFYEEYGYDPDEQKIDIQSKIMHLDDVEQITIDKFIEIYETKSELTL